MIERFTKHLIRYCPDAPVLWIISGPYDNHTLCYGVYSLKINAVREMNIFVNSSAPWIKYRFFLKEADT